MDMDMSMDMSTDSVITTTMSMSMPMYFTNTWAGSSVLFQNLTPSTPLALFGVWMAIFFAAIVYRGLTFLKTHLEATSWSPEWVSGGQSDFLLKEGKGLKYVQPFSIYRDGGRAALVFVTAMFGYALMLVVMSFVVTYFFAVITGLAIGELIFGRLSAGLGGLGQQEHH